MEKRQCPKCGAKLSKTARCCVECGEFLETLPVSASPSQSREAISLAQTEDFNNRIKRVLGSDQKPSEPQTADIADEENEEFFPDEKSDKKAKTISREKDMSTDISLPALMGLQLLFFIPVIGLIAAVIFYVCTKNPTLKLLARSRIVWAIILVSVAAVFIAVYELWLRNFLISQGLGIWEFSMPGANTVLNLRELTLTKLFG